MLETRPLAANTVCLGSPHQEEICQGCLLPGRAARGPGEQTAVVCRPRGSSGGGGPADPGAWASSLQAVWWSSFVVEAARPWWSVTGARAELVSRLRRRPLRFPLPVSVEAAGAPCVRGPPRVRRPWGPCWRGASEPPAVAGRDRSGGLVGEETCGERVLWDRYSASQEKVGSGSPAFKKTWRNFVAKLALQNGQVKSVWGALCELRRVWETVMGERGAPQAMD